MSVLDWIRAIPGAIATVADLVNLIRWLNGEDVPQPVVLTKVPAMAQSTAIKIRMRSRAAESFGVGPPE